MEARCLGSSVAAGTIFLDTTIIIIKFREPVVIIQNPEFFPLWRSQGALNLFLNVSFSYLVNKNKEKYAKIRAAATVLYSL